MDEQLQIAISFLILIVALYKQVSNVVVKHLDKGTLSIVTRLEEASSLRANAQEIFEKAQDKKERFFIEKESIISEERARLAKLKRDSIMQADNSIAQKAAQYDKYLESLHQEFLKVRSLEVLSIASTLIKEQNIH